MSTNSKAPLRAFFDAFGKGDFEGILNTFHAEAVITAVHDGPRSNNEIYGTYEGSDGVKTFLSNLGNTFETQSFSVESLIGEGDVAFANGKFVHKVKATNKLFPSDWVLRVAVKDNKIINYHFYENSAAFIEANS